MASVLPGSILVASCHALCSCMLTFYSIGGCLLIYITVSGQTICHHPNQPITFWQCFAVYQFGIIFVISLRRRIYRRVMIYIFNIVARIRCGQAGVKLSVGGWSKGIYIYRISESMRYFDRLIFDENQF